jgi:hypothetical protein
VNGSLEVLSRIHRAEEHPLVRYRRDILGGVSDAEILTRAGEGDIQNLRRMLDTRGEQFLLRRISQTLSAFEREQLGNVNAPEWTVNPHNTLRNMFALVVRDFLPRR